MLLQRLFVARPGVELPQREDEIERAGEIAVVAIKWRLAQPHERSALSRADDASGLFVAPRVRTLALQASEAGQNGFGHLAAVEDAGLPDGGQRVSPPQIQETWYSGGGR